MAIIGCLTYIWEKGRSKRLFSGVRFVFAKYIFLFLYVLFEVAASIERNESPNFNGYLNEISKGIENPTALLLGTSPTFTFIMCLIFCFMIILLYQIFKTIVSHNKVPKMLKCVLGLGYLYVFRLILTGLYNDVLEMLKWNFYISVLSSSMLATFFVLTVVEIWQFIKNTNGNKSLW